MKNNLEKYMDYIK